MSGRYATEQGAWDDRNGIQRTKGDLEGSRIGNDYKEPIPRRLSEICVHGLPTKVHWCRACRDVGMIHCSDPENCGGKLKDGELEK